MLRMEEVKELPSDSDSEDEDYLPEGNLEKESEESEGEDEEAGSDGEKKKVEGSKRKRGEKAAFNKKKVRATEEEKHGMAGEENKENPKEEKARKDRLWADFMKDCEPPAKSTPVQPSTVEEKPSEKGERPAPESKESSKVKVTQIFEFAGEKVTVEKEVDKSNLQEPPGPGTGRGRGPGGSSSGLTAILGMIGKKGKLSTLEKTKLDWDKFKKDEGIQEQLQSHNRGRNGYLEKQDFLQRADIRQFEIEKEMRSSKRSNR